MGGNKVRKLQHLITDANEQGCNTLVTVGAAQSNHARLTAIMGRIHGLEVHLVLMGKPGLIEGNLVLDELVGAQISWYPGNDWAGLDAMARALVDSLRADGKMPYFIPLGGSTPVGARGYLTAYEEIIKQLPASAGDATIVHASSTGGTQAGLIAGHAIHGGPVVLGVDVIKGGTDLKIAATELAIGLITGHSNNIPVVNIIDGTGPAYGVVTPEVAAAVSTALVTEGLVLDPVYTGKAMAALMGRPPELMTDAAIFIHTGGQPAIWTANYTAALLGRD